MADAVTPRLVPVERLRPATWNPRRAPKRRLEALTRAIEADPEFLWHRNYLQAARAKLQGLVGDMTLERWMFQLYRRDRGGNQLALYAARFRA